MRYTKAMLKKYLLWAVIAIVVIGGIVYVVRANAEPGKLDAFAQCLSEKGAKFYGAFWCPHCQAQKKIFGRSEKYLPYVECSTPNGKAQLPACNDKKIEGYPTWEFADGSREAGELTLNRLAEKTACTLPEGK